jgi:replicative DNA helicase
MHDPKLICPNPALLSDLGRLLLNEEAIAREARALGKPAGPVTGISQLDDELGGSLSPGIHTLLAAPGVGKTAFALQIAANCGCPALYVTAEMRQVDLLRRNTARATDTFLGKLRGGQLSEDDLKALLDKAARQCPQMAIYDAVDNPANAAEIQEKADLLRKRFGSQTILIVIDSVTDWALRTGTSQEGSATASEYLLAESALNSLKQISSNLSCPVLAIAHRNRSGQKAQGADKLHSAKATGRYEYVSESFWDLERDTSVEPDKKGQSPAELTLLKNRHGSTGLSIELRFEGRLQKFTEPGRELP